METVDIIQQLADDLKKIWKEIDTIESEYSQIVRASRDLLSQWYQYGNCKECKSPPHFRSIEERDIWLSKFFASPSPRMSLKDLSPLGCPLCGYRMSVEEWLNSDISNLNIPQEKKMEVEEAKRKIRELNSQAGMLKNKMQELQREADSKEDELDSEVTRIYLIRERITCINEERKWKKKSY